MNLIKGVTGDHIHDENSNSYHFFRPCCENFPSWTTGWWVSTHLTYQSNWIISPGIISWKSLKRGPLERCKIPIPCLTNVGSVEKPFRSNHSTQPMSLQVRPHSFCLIKRIYLKTDWPGDFPFLVSRFFFPLKSTLHLSKPTRRSSICRWTFPMLPPPKFNSSPPWKATTESPIGSRIFVPTTTAFRGEGLKV